MLNIGQKVPFATRQLLNAKDANKSPGRRVSRIAHALQKKPVGFPGLQRLAASNLGITL